MHVPPVSRPVLSNAGMIVEAVLDAVAAGRLPAGSKLGEDQLSRFFSVSRTVVREALKELKHFGVVDLFPNRGAFVACPTPEEVLHVYAARRIIETAIVEDVARHVTANDIRTLRRHVALQHAAYERRNRREYIRLMGEFHILIARLAGNPVLVGILERLIAQTSLMTALFEDPHDGCPIDDHNRLIQRLVAGDAKGCVAIMAKHLDGNRRRFRIPMNRPRVDLARALRRSG